MKISINKYLTYAAVLFAALQFSLVSCTDKNELGEGGDNYYTATKEYAADFLRNRPEYSMYVQVLERATGEDNKLKLMDLLGSYGSVTVFAPTNDAVSAYISQFGASSVDELSKEICDTIALTSIIEQAYFLSDHSEDIYPVPNMLERYLSIASRDDAGPDGNIKTNYYINQKSLIVQEDDSVSNGVVHTVNTVVTSVNDMLPDVIEKDSKCRIFAKMLRATHVAELMYLHKDPNYTIGADSIDFTNPSLVVPTATEFDNVAYPANRYYKFTAFVPTDDVFKSKYGITEDDINNKDESVLIGKLLQIAHEHYDEVYPLDAGEEDITKRNNALNRMVSYHCLDRQGGYYQLTGEDGMVLSVNWDRTLCDISDWYETMMPHSILKCSFPDGGRSTKGLYINRRGVKAGADYYGVYKRGAKLADPKSYDGVDNNALNGIYHYIDDVIFYDSETQNETLNERIRLDASTLSPDFMNQGARGYQPRGQNYAKRDTKATIDNKMECIGFKPGSAKNFTFGVNTHLHVRSRVPSFWSYQGDEVTVLGAFDLMVKIPPVPTGDYEVRFFTCVNFSTRGIIQAYFGSDPNHLEVCGIPFDMRWDGKELFGWQPDKVKDRSVYDEADLTFDKQIHNLGWMKGPDSYYSASSEDGGAKGTCFRDMSFTVRKVITQAHIEGDKDYYIRFQQKRDPGDKCALNFDFIELCPVGIYNSPAYPEDRH